MVVVGPNPVTGLLTTQFTVYYGVGGSSIGDIEGLRGVVTIHDPIETLPVRHTHTHTHAHTPYRFHFPEAEILCQK